MADIRDGPAATIMVAEVANADITLADLSVLLNNGFEERIGHSLPLMPGAIDAVRRLGERWPLGLASSSNREVIDLVLELAGIAEAFGATVSSEEVGPGKPAPDVYLEVARRLRVEVARSGASEFGR